MAHTSRCWNYKCNQRLPQREETSSVIIGQQIGRPLGVGFRLENIKIHLPPSAGAKNTNNRCRHVRQISPPIIMPPFFLLESF